MKLIFKTIIIAICFSGITSCSSSEIKNDEIIFKTDYNSIKIAKISRIIDSNTITFNELRFYNINSALDAAKTMYIDYGLWNNEDKELHQQNISRKIWKNVELFKDEDKFTVIADGKETFKESYACLIVFDANDRDCLEENHPLKNKIITLFYNIMKANQNKELNFK